MDLKSSKHRTACTMHTWKYVFICNPLLAASLTFWYQPVRSCLWIKCVHACIHVFSCHRSYSISTPNTHTHTHTCTNYTHTCTYAFVQSQTLERLLSPGIRYNSAVIGAEGLVYVASASGLIQCLDYSGYVPCVHTNEWAPCLHTTLPHAQTPCMHTSRSPQHAPAPTLSWVRAINTHLHIWAPCITCVLCPSRSRMHRLQGFQAYA
jgi:hypothetical protein